MNYQFLAPEIDADPYAGSCGYAVIESYEEDNFRERETQTCAAEDGELAFAEECRRVQSLRKRDKTLSPIVVRLLFSDLEEKREVI